MSYSDYSVPPLSKPMAHVPGRQIRSVPGAQCESSGQGPSIAAEIERCELSTQDLYISVSWMSTLNIGSGRPVYSVQHLQADFPGDVQAGSVSVSNVSQPECTRDTGWSQEADAYPVSRLSLHSDSRHPKASFAECFPTVSSFAFAPPLRLTCKLSPASWLGLTLQFVATA